MELHNFHLQQLHLRLRRPGELGQVFASSGLRTFAMSLVTIFVPIYLLSLGYSLPEVFGYLALANALHALLVGPAAWVASRKGMKHAILASVLFEVAYFFVLARLGAGQFSVVGLLALISGIQRALYFTGLHLDLAKFTKPGHRGSELGGMRFLAGIFHALGPAVGGFLLASVGFKSVFLAAGVMIALSGLPLLFSPDTRTSGRVKLANVFKGRRLGDFLGFAGYGIESGASGNIWALFLFLNVIGTYQALGSIASAAMVISLFANLAVGAMTNRHKHRVLRAGSVLDAILGFGRLFATVPLHAFALNSASGISKKLIYIPMDIISYDNADKSGTAAAAEEYIVFREMSINGVRALFYALMIFVSSLPLGLAIGALASLLFLFF